VRRIGGFATGEVEGNGIAVEVCFQMDFRREPASRAAQRLALLPPFAPAAETWARTTVLSNICTTSRHLLRNCLPASGCAEGLSDAR
jgi:hypothetical protein